MEYCNMALSYLIVCGVSTSMVVLVGFFCSYTQWQMVFLVGWLGPIRWIDVVTRILNIRGPHGCGCLRCAEDESFVVALHLHYTVLDEWSVCLLTTKHPKSLPQIEMESACAPRDQAAIPL